MNKDIILDIESKVLDRLHGKVHLLQEREDRESVVSNILSEVCGSLEKDLLLGKVKHLKSDKERKEFIKNFLSYGEIEDLLCDPAVEDIIINSTNHIFIHHARKGLIKTDKRFKSLRELDIFIRKLVIFSGRSEVKQLENLELHNIQGRVNIAPSPLGPQVTITKAKSEPLSILDIIAKGTLSYDLAAQLWLYVEGLSVRPASLIICGAPGSGKTTLLNALFSFIPANERIVVMEDTLELNTQLEESCSRLESTAELSLADLVKNTLRMRPDRLVIGEVRGEEAKDLMTAVNIGKYCMGTIHASTAREAIIRMQNEPMNVPPTLVSLVDVFLIMKKFNFKDRVVRTVAEVSETGGLEQKTVLLSQTWKYDYETRKMRQLQPSTIYRDKLSRETGLSPKDIMDEVKVRAKVLELLHAKGLSTLKEVTDFCRLYNADSEGALAKLGLERKDLLSENKKYTS
jgi:flagellar protein FlaI